MNHTLKLTLYNAPGAVERVLQTIRFRQFTLLQMELEQVFGDKIRMQFSVNSDRHIQLLTTQLNKLVDLATLSVESGRLQAAAHSLP